MRIFPEMWASTLCPFSSSTRNMAFGSGSVTVPSTRIMSSLGLTRTSHHLKRVMLSARGARRAERTFGRPDRIPKFPSDCQLAGGSRQGQHLGAVLGDGDG